MSISSKISTPERVQYFYMGYGQKEAIVPLRKSALGDPYALQKHSTKMYDPKFWLKSFQWLGRVLKGKTPTPGRFGHPAAPTTSASKIINYLFPGTVGVTAAVRQKNKMDLREDFHYEQSLGRWESERDQDIAEGRAAAELTGAVYHEPLKWQAGVGKPNPPVHDRNWIASTISGFGAGTAMRPRYWRNLAFGGKGKAAPGILRQLTGTVFPVAAYQSPHFQEMFYPTKRWIKEKVDQTTEGLQGLQEGALRVQQTMEGLSPDAQKFMEELLGTKEKAIYKLKVDRYNELRAEYEASDLGIEEMAKYEKEMKTWEDQRAGGWRELKASNAAADALWVKFRRDGYEGPRPKKVGRPPQPTLPGPVDPGLQAPSSLMDEFKLVVSTTKELATNTALLTKQLGGDLVQGAAGMASSADNIDGVTAHLWNILDHAEKAVEGGLAYVKDNKRAVIATGAAYMLVAGGVAGVIYWLKEVNERRTLEEQDKRLARQQTKMMKMVLKAQKEDQT